MSAPTDEELLRRAVWAATGTKRRPRWGHVKQIFAVGATTAKELCLRFDVDPDQEVGGSAGWVPPLRPGQEG